ncbi:MAG TPA: glycosyltransferase family 2 protein [Chitinophagales bacterium]|nr:glycosyltransferase family 2 protein [Chitinophagales bacterium]
MHLSVVSPIYNAALHLEEFVTELEKYILPITNDYEIVLVDDFSPDNSWKHIEAICTTHPKVKGIKLSRNFGQHYAITAGLDNANGEWIIVMDCDFQDAPSEIPNLYNKTKEDFDVVLARRINRKDGFIKKLFSKLFWKTLGWLTGTNIDHTVANFGIYNKKVIQAVCSLRESIRFFPSMILWVGFSKTTLDVEHQERQTGTSGYNFSRMFKLALDVMLAYSDKPIRLVIKMGFFISLFTLLIGLYYLYLNITNQILVPGYTSLIISIWFLSGLIILILGILGLYIGKTFEGVKNRPIYIIEKKLNGNRTTKMGF